ncbi:MAG: class I SAM-dependent methyltransferase [Promethearchaeota archaeon]|jgi:SAM-dependent methyltransferase
MDLYLSGKKLYGDDFDSERIKRWYKDESEGYANLGAKDKVSYKYGYHSLNNMHGFKYIKMRRFNNVLGFGSAYGDEFLPIINQIERLTIIDPSEAFFTDEVHGIPCEYIKPSFEGQIPFDDGYFDLIVCLGVLHHIPNVSTVIKEFYRCLSNNGIVLLREPIESMGDWSKNRRGLTKKERGIPLDILQNIINNAGFRIELMSLCVFALIPKIFDLIGISAYNHLIPSWIDAKLSNLFRWNIRYHATSFLHKFRPKSVFLVIKKE